jgi:hypothetical protein
MTEVERVQKADSASMAFAAIRGRMDNLVSHDIYPPISAIDKGDFDGLIWKNGSWEGKSDAGVGSGSGVGSGFGVGTNESSQD